MKRLILFSLPSDEVKEKIKDKLFPKELAPLRFAYMTTNGREGGEKYLPIWEEYAKSNNAELIYIDNTKRGGEAKLEIEKLLSCNILMSTGGNTFQLLNNLRESGLFEAILEFTKKDSFVFAGFSAGSILMTPTIAVAGRPAGNDPSDSMDENIPGITDLTALSLVDFEVYPHYDVNVDTTNLENYRKLTTNEVKPISDSEYLILDI